MLKPIFLPYSEKLRQATQRRSDTKQTSISDRTTLEIGDHAPEFRLYNTENQQVSLHDLTARSNVVLLFFPLAFTDTCTTELCSVRDNMAKYSQLNATVLGLSIDSMFALKKLKEEEQLPFELLSDFNKEAARRFGVLYEQFPLFHMKNVAKRAAFVIDQQGKIQHIDILAEPGRLPNFKAIEVALARCANK